MTPRKTQPQPTPADLSLEKTCAALTKQQARTCFEGPRLLRPRTADLKKTEVCATRFKNEIRLMVAPMTTECFPTGPTFEILSA